MLFLLFRLGQDRYALEAAQVAQVIPLVDVKKIPHAPLGVAGVFNFRDAPVPLIDLSQLALGRPAQVRLSTRIVLVRYPDAQGKARLLGLVAEQATETVRLEPGEFRDAGVTAEGAPYLGPVLTAPDGLIQWIDADKLLSASVREALFNTAEQARATPS
jgi:chemotaxis-related protein WspB